MDIKEIINWNELAKLYWHGRSWVRNVENIENFWDEKAEAFAQEIRNRDTDNYVKKIIKIIKNRSELKAKDTVLDIGCGSGILTLPMAKMCKKVSACDISKEMLAILDGRAKESNLKNIVSIHRAWMDIKPGKDLKKHDIVISHRSFGISSCYRNSGIDYKKSILKMHSYAKKAVFIIYPAYNYLLDYPDFIKKFPRIIFNKQEKWAALLTYILACLEDLYPTVEYLNFNHTKKFSNLNEMVEFFNSDIAVKAKKNFKGSLTRYFLKKFKNPEKEIILKVRKRVKIIWWLKEHCLSRF
ncbi:class I SAM-dependent methyltransferase [Candidatus Riflebacteria bacterium]